MEEKHYGSIGTRVGEVTKVALSDQIRSDLGIKGGGVPQFQLPEVADVQFVYLMNPNISVNTPSSLPVRTSASASAVIPAGTPNNTLFATAGVLVPDGANNIIVDMVPTAWVAATNGTLAWQGSDDGVTWPTQPTGNNFQDAVQSAVPVGVGDGWSTWQSVANTDQFGSRRALPKYVRGVYLSQSVLNDFTIKLTVTVG